MNGTEETSSAGNCTCCCPVMPEESGICKDRYSSSSAMPSMFRSSKLSRQ